MPKGKVLLKEETTMIPTYERGLDDRHPPLLNRAATWIYPYPIQANISGKTKTDKQYKSVILENRYLKIIFLPELGGRIYSVLNKTNNREMFYRNDVIKYARVGLRGAWITGGVEFNFPNGHTVTTVNPVNYILKENPDGSAGIIIYDLERVSRMKWAVSVTLHPDRSYYELEVNLYNRTELEHPYWFWHNAGVVATADWRFISPSNKILSYRNDIRSFPVHEGEDISWIREQPDPIDFFSLELKDDFFGCYHYDLGTGIIQVADRNEVQGRKMFTWGYGNFIKLWERILTDKGGPPGEIQSGRFSTQEIRHMFPPHSKIGWKEWWWPCRDMDGFVYANKDIALNVNEQKKGIEIALNSTYHFLDATLIVSRNNKEIRKIKVEVAPDKPFRSVLSDLPSNESKGLTFSFYDSDGLCRGAYASRPKDVRQKSTSSFTSYAMPLPSFKKNTAIAECLAGAETLEKRDLRREAEKEYKRAVEIDPGSPEANFNLGRFLLRRGRFAEAEKYLSPAFAVSSFSSRIIYHLGLALRNQEKLAEAEELFVQTRLIDSNYLTLANYQLAEIALLNGDPPAAEKLLKDGLANSPRDVRTATLLSVVLRKTGNWAEAKRLISAILKENPTDEWAGTEYFFIAAAAKNPRTIPPVPTRKLIFDEQAALEVANDYLKVGLVTEALKILEGTADSKSPIFHYWIGYCRYQLKDTAGAREAFRNGSQFDATYVFPHRPESLKILELALRLQPDDAKIEACLGYLLCSIGEEDRAAGYWKKAVKHNPSDSVSWGCLALYLWKVKQRRELALKAYENAIRIEPDSWQLLVERDTLLSELNRHEERVSKLENIPKDIASWDRVALSFADALLFTGRLDECINFLRRLDVGPWEGEKSGREIYSKALITRALLELKAGNLSSAIEDFKESTTFPLNLGSAEPSRYKNCAKNYFLLGKALEMNGLKKEAKTVWKRAITEIELENSESRFYQALCHLHLDKTVIAKKIIDNIKKFCLESIEESVNLETEPHYLLSLVYAFEGKETSSLRELATASKISPSRYEVSDFFSKKLLCDVT